MANLLERTFSLAQSNFTADNVPTFLGILQNCLYDAPASTLSQSWDNIVKITSQITANPALITSKNQAVSVLQVIGKTMESSVSSSTATSAGNYQERARTLIDKGV